jgi:GntR family transcriptional regulator/MocR family aminotransferase
LSGLLEREGVPLFAANVDSEGLEPSSLPVDRAALAFVTSSHQYPLGAVLSAPRRAALVEWARASDSYIFEDDFDGDFRYGGAPLQPLRELDPERVLYAGSFSKSFSPGLRLGYAIVPPRLRDGWRVCRELADIHSCAFTQAAMASFLASGSYERHVARMRKVYAERRAAMLAALRGCFGENIEVMGAAAGLHVAVRFSGAVGERAPRFDEATVARIASGGAIVYPASRYAFAPYAGIRSILLLGYGHLSEEEMKRGLGIVRTGLAP